MYSNNNTLAILTKSIPSVLFLDPFTLNAEQLCNVLDDGVAAFITWSSFFWFEITPKGFANAF